MRNDDDVVPIGDRGELSSNGLSQAAFDAISHHGVSNLLADCQRHPTGSILSGCIDDENTGQPDATAFALDPLDVPRQPQAAFTGKTQRSALAALAGYGRNQALAALRATALDDVPTASGLHTSAEAVAPLTLDVARLVCALHVDLQSSGQPPDCAGMSPLWHGPVCQAPPLRARCLYRHSHEGKKAIILLDSARAREGSGDQKSSTWNTCVKA